jgi:hypothetical protein
MEDLKELFSDLKSRLNSPLFGSYLISWLVFNWRIPVTLILYKQNELCLDNYNSFADVIYKNTNVLNNLLLPLTVALVYTFVFPFFKEFIRRYQTKIKIQSQDKIYELTYNARSYKTKIEELNSAHEIEMARYSNLAFQLEGSRQESASRLDEIGRNKNELDQLIKQRNDLTTALDLNNKANDTRSMDGSWTVSGFTVDPQVWKIRNGKIYINDTVTYIIESIVANVATNTSAMLYYAASDVKDKQTIFFTSNSTPSFLFGMLYSSTGTFERIPT